MKRLDDRDLAVERRSRIRPLSGRKARRFRARWAACAEHCDATMRAIKLPLEIPDGRVIDAEAMAALHATLRESRPGTLIWLLLTVHASGFRLFSKADEVVGFMNADLLDNGAYGRRLGEGIAGGCGRLDPVHLYLRFRTVPRPARGTGLPFTAEVIAREYARYFCGAAAEGESAAAGLIADLARRLEGLGGWGEIAAAPDRAFAAWDEVVRAAGLDLPALAPRLRHLALPPPIVSKATIAYDRRKPALPLHPEHTLPLLAANALLEARAEGLAQTPALARRVLQMVLTDNYSGLSWLWGSGLRLLRQASVADCQRWFAVGEEVAAGLALAARWIPGDGVFGGDVYASYRADVGGTLAGWIGRHVATLAELDRRMAGPADVGGLEAARFAFPDARQALDRLLGKKPGATAADLGTVEQYVEQVADLHRRLPRLPAGARAGSPPAAVHHGPLPRPARMSAPRDTIALCREAAQRFGPARGFTIGLAERALAWCAESDIAALPFEGLAQELRRQEMPEPRGARAGDPLLDAVKRLLDRIGRVARRQPDAIARRIMAAYADHGVFAREQELRRFFLSREGSLFKPAAARSHRSVVPIDPSVVHRRGALWSAIGDAVRLLQREMFEKPFEASGVSALVELEQAYYGAALRGIPDRLPSAVIPPPPPWMPVTAALRRELGAPTVDANTLRHLFNVNAAKVRELAAILVRDRFSVRHVFTRCRDNALVYVPKASEWKVPARLWCTPKPIGAALRSLGPRDAAIPARLLARARESLERQPGMRECLVQSPHDWYYAGLPGGTSVRGMSVSKAGMAKRIADFAGALRLAGPSSLKGSLDEALLLGRSAVGDVQVICERHFVQGARWEEGGAGVRVEIRPEGCSLALGIPLREEPPAGGPPVSMERYVCVDLGEYGVGWVAFDAASHEEIAHGFEAVASLRSLARRLRAARRIGGEVRVQARGHRRAGERRRVAGEIAHVIDSLLSKFRAFPVFERDARRARRSGEIGRIHEAVIESYALVERQSAAGRRKARWRGGERWKHPRLLAVERQSGRPEPLILFPGTTVPAHGNSQLCSRCGRNAIDAVRSIAADASRAFAIAGDGSVDLPDGTIRIHRGPASARRGQGHAGETASARTAPRGGSISAQRLIKAIKENIRRPPHDARVRASAYSRYRCVYVDCCASEDADVNAARNIARRFRHHLFDDAPRSPEEPRHEGERVPGSTSTCPPIWTGP